MFRGSATGGHSFQTFCFINCQIFQVGKIDCESNAAVFHIKSQQFLATERGGRLGTKRRRKHVKLQKARQNSIPTLETCNCQQIMGALGSEVRSFLLQMPTFEYWILLCTGDVSATKKDNNQPPGSHQLHQNSSM